MRMAGRGVDGAADIIRADRKEMTRRGRVLMPADRRSVGERGALKNPGSVGPFHTGRGECLGGSSIRRRLASDARRYAVSRSGISSVARCFNH